MRLLQTFGHFMPLWLVSLQACYFSFPFVERKGGGVHLDPRMNFGRFGFDLKKKQLTFSNEFLNKIWPFVKQSKFVLFTVLKKQFGKFYFGMILDA